MATSSPATAPKDSNDYQSTRDNYIPIFDGTPSNYREWRKRITIYEKKMELSNRKNEGVLNLLGSLQGTAWKLVEDFDLEKASHPTAFTDILTMLDTAFKYDSKVELPSDFSAYFETLNRRNGQSLLQFVTDHDDRLRRSKYKDGTCWPNPISPESNANWWWRKQTPWIAQRFNRHSFPSWVKTTSTAMPLQPTPTDGQSAPLEKAEPTSWKTRTMMRATPMNGDTTWLRMTTLHSTRPMDNGKMMAMMTLMLMQPTSTRAATMTLRTLDLTLKNTTSAMPPTWMLANVSMSFAWAVDFFLWWPWIPTAAALLRLKCLLHPKEKVKARKAVERAVAVERTTSSTTSLQWKHQTLRAVPMLLLVDHLSAYAVAQQIIELPNAAKDPNHLRSLLPRNPTSDKPLRPLQPPTWRTPKPAWWSLRIRAALNALTVPWWILVPQASWWIMDHFAGTSTPWRSWTSRSTRSSSRRQIALSTSAVTTKPWAHGRCISLSLSTINSVWFRHFFWRERHPCCLVDPLPKLWACPWTSWMIASSTVMVNGNLQLLAGTASTWSLWLRTMTQRSSPMVPPSTWSLKMRMAQQSTSSTSRPRKISKFMLVTAKPPMWPLPWAVTPEPSAMKQVGTSLFEPINGPSWTYWTKRCLMRFSLRRLAHPGAPCRTSTPPPNGSDCRFHSCVNGTTACTYSSAVESTFDNLLKADMPTSNSQLQLSAGKPRPSEICRATRPTSTNASMDVSAKTPTMNGNRWRKQPPCRRAKRQFSRPWIDFAQVIINTAALKVTRLVSRWWGNPLWPAMASTLAAALATPESPHPWDFGFAVQEIQEYAGKMVELHVEGKAEALRVVQKLHRNLGHPTTKSLVELLQSRGASDTVIQVAGSYVCAACQRYKRPNQPAPSALSDVHDFNEKVQSDVFWIKDQDVKYPILSTIDMATKYQTAALIHREQTQDLILGLERSWISVFGPPSELITDEGRAWVSDGMTEWTDSHSIKYTVAPGEAHTRLSLVERRHAVLRKSIEVMMTDL